MMLRHRVAAALLSWSIVACGGSAAAAWSLPAVVPSRSTSRPGALGRARRVRSVDVPGGSLMRLGAHDHDGSEDDVNQSMLYPQETSKCHNRRTVVAALLSTAPLLPSNAATAEEDGFSAPMNDLTRQIRTTVVRGAQLIDKVDGRWERFSDDLGLGAERNRPKRNVIDAGGNGVAKGVVRSEEMGEGEWVWDQEFAWGLLRECDEAFVSCLKSSSQTSIGTGQLMQQIDETKRLLRKSFFAASAPASKQEEYNFECYAHFRVYNELLVKERVNFPPFQREYEALVGTALLRLAMQQQPTLVPSTASSPSLTERVQTALRATDAIANLLQTKGLIASWERSIPPIEDIEDFVSPAAATADNFSVSSDLPYSLALYGDATLNAQLLLQELGYRLYPSFGRWLVREGVARCFDNGAGDNGNTVTVQIDDYYMDTSYNSNPDLFEVRQVLLNIVVQRD